MIKMMKSGAHDARADNDETDARADLKNNMRILKIRTMMSMIGS